MTEETKMGESFSLTLAIKDFSNFIPQSSPKEEHCGMEWHIVSNYRNDNLTLLLIASDEGPQRRSSNRRRRLKIEYSFFFTSPKKFLIKRGVDKSDSISWFSEYQLMNFEETKNTQMVDDTVIVQCYLTVRETIPELSPRSDFSIPSEQLVTDVVLVVEDREFHVSKAVLASFSTYFKTMFYEKYRESDESRVVLEEVNPDKFQVFLKVIYHETNVTIDNVAEVLELAVYFDVKDIQDKCEQVLLKSSPLQVPTDQKLLLADKYMLPELMKHVVYTMENLKTVEQVQRVRPEKKTRRVRSRRRSEHIDH